MVKGSHWAVARRAAVMIFGVAVIGFIYWMGLWDVAGALALSGLLVLLVDYVRSGALPPVCLQRRNVSAVRNSARWEFSKAMICAGAGLDIVRPLVIAGYGRVILHDSVISEAAALALGAVWLVGIGVFLVRSFAAYLLSLRP